MSYNGARAQISYGYHPLIDHQPLTGGGFSGGNITGLSGLTNLKYVDEEMWILSGTNAGQVYHVVTNGTTSITVQESTSGLAATDRVCFTSRHQRPTTTSLHLASDYDQELPDAKHTLMQKHYHGQGVEPVQTFVLKSEYPGKGIKSDLIHPFLLLGILGGEYGSGTDVGGGGGSTVSGAHYAGDVTLNAADATNYGVGDWIQVGTGASPPATGTKECREITAKSVNALTLDWPLSYAHADGETLNEVAAPFTNLIVAAKARPPWICLEAVYDEATDFVRHWLGGHLGSVEIEGSSDGSVMLTLSDCQWLDQQNNATSGSTVTVIATQPYQWSHVSGGITLNSVVYASLESWKLTINRPVKTAYFHSSTYSTKPSAAFWESLDYDFECVVVPQNTNFATLLADKTEFNVSLNYIRTAASDEITIAFTNMTLEEAGHPLPRVGEVRTTLKGKFENLTVTAIDSYGHHYLQNT